MSNQPLKSPPPARPGTHPRRLRKLAVAGLIAAAIVFSGFLLYAFVAPSVFRTNAQIKVEASAEDAASLPQPLEAARRLKESALDRDLLAKLAQEETRTTSSDTGVGAATRIRGAFEIDSLDGRTFTVWFRDADAARAARVCNQLAERAAERAATALRHARPGGVNPRELELEALTSFIAAHPEVTSQTLATQGAAANPANDPVLRALRSERTSIEARLATAAPPSDNPYEDPKAAADADPATLKRRLLEISTLVATRQKALEHAEPSDKIAPAIQAEWSRLLQRAADAESAVGTEKPLTPITARVTRPASVPTSPFEPNRARLLLLGLVVSALTGFVFALIRAAVPQRRRSSSRSRSGSGSSGPSSRNFSDFGAASSHKLRTALELPNVEKVPSNPAFEAIAAETFAATQFQMPSPPPPPPLLATQTILGAQAAVAAQAAAAGSAIAARPIVAAQSLPSQPTVTVSAATDDAAPAVAAGLIVDAKAELVGPTPIDNDRAAARRQGPTRKTQLLGSVLSKPIDGVQVPEERAPTTYSYMSSPPAPLPTPPNPSPPPQPLPRQEQEPSIPYPKAAPVPRPSISVQEAGRGWGPERDVRPERNPALTEDILQRAARGRLVIGISGSARAADIKARAAAELALALGDRLQVLLLEGNLQRPQVQRWMQISMPISAGLSQQLNAYVAAPVAPPWTVMQCTRSVHALAEGVFRSPGLILSQAFYECVMALRESYDVVLIDGPVISETVECRALDSTVDLLVFVSSREDGAELARMLAQFTQPVISLVMELH